MEVTEVTEVTETVVTEMVATEAVEVGSGWPGLVRRGSLGGYGRPGSARGDISEFLLQVSPGPLDTLRSWLDGMEELQASQAPLAPDVTVAAAQLREQEVQSG